MGKRERSPWPPPRWGADALLDQYPDLALRPVGGDGDLVIGGQFSFSASDARGGPAVADTFAIELRVPPGFPTTPPGVRESAGRIPRTFHTNHDGTLCLGSPLRLRMALRARPDLIGFVEGCLVPYLYGFVRHERGESLPFGELDHGDRGLLDEYRRLLRAPDDRACVELVALLGVRRRIANKRACPCSSGRRVGRCHHRALNHLRRAAPRSWFATAAASLGSAVLRPDVVLRRATDVLTND